MYTYAAGSPGTFGDLGAMSFYNAMAAARVQEIHKAIAIVKTKAPVALPLLYGALSHAQQAMTSPSAEMLIRQAEVGYRAAAVTASRQDVSIPPLKHIAPPVKAEAPTPTTTTVTTTPQRQTVPTGLPGAQAGAQYLQQAQGLLQRQYGPLPAWQWLVVAGGGVVAIAIAQKLMKYALIGGAVAGGALLVGKAGGLKLPTTGG